MQLSEIVTMLTEIDGDVNLPMKAQGEIDKDYVNRLWPGLLQGITDYCIDPQTGLRSVDNIKSLTAAGFHAFSTHRNDSPDVPAGRVQTTKGMLMFY